MRKSTSNQNRNQSKHQKISVNLVQFLKKQYPNKIPIPMLTGISKMYCKDRQTTKDSKVIKRFAENSNQVNTVRLIEYLGSENQFKKGAQLTDDHIKKIFLDFCNPEGKLTFQYLMKMGEKTGWRINEQLAKAIVKKYAKKKEFLNLEDCQKIVRRRYANVHSTKLQKER